MTPEQRRMARHALGLDGERVVSYRNRYCAAQESAAHHAWHEMHKSGWAGEPTYGQDVVHYHLTLPGATLALESGERLDREDFPGVIPSQERGK